MSPASPSSPPEGRGEEAGARRWGVLFAGVWLFYLLSPLHAGWQRRDELSGWVGMVATLAFAALYLTVFVTMRLRRPGTPFQVPLPLWLRLGVLVGEVVLAVVMGATVGQAGTAAAVYIGVTGVICLASPWTWLLALAVGGTAYAAGFVVPDWHRDDSILFGVLVATLAVWGIGRAINGSIEMVAVREENARLALEDQRNGFARDLHDILGHSLTVITVKAELASRLVDADPARARAELDDLERLSRDALADVRRAVDGYRELTLPGELARARAALRAAEIRAELPNATEEVPTAVRELFAWAVREGVRNILRHSRARTCRIRITPGSLEIIDDGVGPSGGSGHGLAGLRERAATVGAEVVTESLQPGFALKVVVP